jgi:hypothetical protein
MKTHYEFFESKGEAEKEKHTLLHLSQPIILNLPDEEGEQLDQTVKIESASVVELPDSEAELYWLANFSGGCSFASPTFTHAVKIEIA